MSAAKKCDFCKALFEAYQLPDFHNSSVKIEVYDAVASTSSFYSYVPSNIIYDVCKACLKQYIKTLLSALS